MSTYRALTKYPGKKKVKEEYQWATWHDDHYNQHEYGVEFDCEMGRFWHPRHNNMPSRIVEIKEEGIRYIEDVEALVKEPSHYKLPNGIECKEVSKYFSSFKGQAIQYIWRAGKKEGQSEEQDLKKAIECLNIELTKLKS